MRRRFKYTFFLLLTIGLQQLASAQTKPVLTRLDSTSILIGQQTRLRLFVHVPKSAKVEFPAIKDTLTSSIQVVGLDKADTLADPSSPGSHTIRRSYLITSFDEGTSVIPALKFKINGDSLATDPLTLSVNTVRVDTTKAVYDIKKPMAVTYGFMDWLRDNWLWVVLAIVIIGLIIGIFIYFKKRPKPVAQVVETPAPLMPPHLIALKKLSQLRDKKLWQMDQYKEYHSELTDILREYIEARFGISTFEKTTDEILAGLRAVRLDEIQRRRLQQVFTLADLVKFAKERPVATDNEQSLADAIAFVEGTKAVPQFLKEGGTADGLA